MQLIYRDEVDAGSVTVVNTGANAALKTVTVDESDDYLRLAEAIFEVTTTATSTNTNVVPLQITVGGDTKLFNFKPSAAIGTQIVNIKHMFESRTKDTITAGANASGANDAQTSIVAKSLFVWAITPYRSTGLTTGLV